ncbi:MAG: phosphodiester glycosidase family protein [Verrucomicrobiales bacterium]|nr:phosphodiester glycosidase family protein [Verrucomicrobiales bacterium]
MNRRSLPKIALALWVAFSPCEVCFAETIVHEGAEYWIYRLDPEKEKLELFLGEKKGKPNTFPALEERLNRQGKQLKFAVNAGIFEPNFVSSGLHVSEGKTIVKLNLADFKKTRESEFTPNFYLKPNGVFYLLEDGRVGIVESSRYRTLRFASPVRIANQSGPLLAAAGKIHPVLTKDSISTRHRNGLGVTKDGKIIFACTVHDRKKGLSNLYNFSTLFTAKLRCPDALYLDGDISYIFIKGVTPPLRESNWFGGIFAVTMQKP